MRQSFFEHLVKLPHQIRLYGAGALIFERNEPVVEYFAVRAGKALLLRRQLDGTEVILQRAEKGMVLAEASLNTPIYHCSANAISNLELFVFKKKNIEKLLESDPEVSRSLIVHLAKEVQNTRRRAEIISLKTVSDRLTAWLVWHDDILPPKGDWYQVANEIGVSPEALYRELAKRRKLGFIATNRRG